jgi:HEPN domain-containing protein
MIVVIKNNFFRSAIMLDKFDVHSFNRISGRITKVQKTVSNEIRHMRHQRRLEKYMLRLRYDKATMSEMLEEFARGYVTSR